MVLLRKRSSDSHNASQPGTTADIAGGPRTLNVAGSVAFPGMLATLWCAHVDTYTKTMKVFTYYYTLHLVNSLSSVTYLLATLSYLDQTRVPYSWRGRA